MHEFQYNYIPRLYHPYDHLVHVMTYMRRFVLIFGTDCVYESDSVDHAWKLVGPRRSVSKRASGSRLVFAGNLPVLLHLPNNCELSLSVIIDQLRINSNWCIPHDVTTSNPPSPRSPLQTLAATLRNRAVSKYHSDFPMEENAGTSSPHTR